MPFIVRLSALTVRVRRCWRDGAFRLLALALAVAALTLALAVLLRAELTQRYAVRSAELLGGDLVLTGTRPPEAAQIALAAALRHAEVIDFNTVLVRGDELLLVSARAADDHYPLYGSLQVAADRFAPAQPRRQGPLSGELWVADQVIDRLAVAPGAALAVGGAQLKLAAVLRQQPDQGANFYQMNPRVLFNSADLDATGVIGPGTQLHHRLLVAGEAAAIARARSALLATLRPDQRLETVADAAVRSMGPLRELTLWASLGVLLVSLLCGAAIYLATGQRVRRRARLAALLRSFGACRNQLLGHVLGDDFVAVLPAAAAGALAGWGLILILRHLLGWSGPLAATPADWLTLALGPLALWLGFALPQLMALARTPALQVLHRRDVRRPSALPELAAALAAPVLLAGLLTDSLAGLGRLLGSLIALGALLPVLLWPLLKGMDILGERLPLAARLAVRRLSRRPGLTLPLLAALSLALAVLALAGLTGNALPDRWRTQVPARAPNHFVLNLFGADLERFQHWLTKHQAEPQPLYPVVRGRLSEVNGAPVREAITKDDKQPPAALNRDLALTEASALPASNRVEEGAWQPGAGSVSVEQSLAAKLGLQLGDDLLFTTSRGNLRAQVTSMRAVDWDSFEPNFYFMFAPGSFIAEDITWLTSFWLPPGNGARLAELLRELPHLTILDVNTLLAKAQEIVGQASRASALLAILLMVAALLVLAASLLAGQAQRGRDNALLRTLGGGRALLARVIWIEFLTLGGAAAFGATLIAAAALYPLGELLFDGTPPWSPWLLLPLGLGLLVATGGRIASRRALAETPLTLLREDGD